jgi:Ca-activated chloride channel family protein
MSFDRPLVLVALVVLPLLVWLWLVQERRRRRSASAFATPTLIPNLIDRAPGRARIVAPILLLLALAALIVGFSRPHAKLTVPRHEATVVLAIDVSRSMEAQDVRPTRLAAAKQAAFAFLDKVPKTYSVAVVGFGSRAFVAVPPTLDRSLARQALQALTPGEGTAIGDAVVISAKLGQRQRARDGTVPPETILLLSDGARDGGRTTPQAAAQQARALHAPVSTVLVGTAAGVIQRRLVGGYTEQIRVPPSPQTLQYLARATGGSFFRARSAAALTSVYKHLATRTGHTSENRELTDLFGAGGLVLMLAGGAVSALRFRRVP